MKKHFNQGIFLFLVFLIATCFNFSVLLTAYKESFPLFVQIFLFFCWFFSLVMTLTIGVLVVDIYEKIKRDK